MAKHDPHSYTDLTQGKITHIDLYIKADFEAHILKIEADYQLAEPVSGSLFLDTSKIKLEAAQANGQALQWEFDEQDELLGERLHLRGLKNVSSFTLTFATSPEARALQWLPDVQTAGGKHPFLFSQCQAIHARSVFPCQDTPSVRFTFSAEVEVPGALTAVMAAEQVGDDERGANKVFRFKMPQPIPSYLFAIGAGNLVFRELGPRTGVYAEPEVIDAAAWEFAENEEKIEQAEKLLGPYLWGALRPAHFAAIVPVWRHGKPAPALPDADRHPGHARADVADHARVGARLDRQPGDQCYLEDFWLNEGWTTYAETRITEMLDGKEAADLMAVYDEQRLIDIMEFVGMESPLTCLKVPSEGRDPDSPLRLFPTTKALS